MTTNYTLDLNAGPTQVLADGTNTYLYGNSRIAQNSTANGKQYFLGDALGSVRQLVSANGAVTLTRSYEPFGSTLSSAGTGTTAFQFAGEARDATGLTYLRARYLSSNVGRFLTADAWPGDFLRPMSLNGWNYTESNPVNRTDPSGHCYITQFNSSGKSYKDWWSYFFTKPVGWWAPCPGVSVVWNPSVTVQPVKDKPSTPTCTPTPTTAPTSTSAPTGVATTIPAPTQTPSPVVSSSGLQLPIDDPVYWNGFGLTAPYGDGNYDTHDGYDITSASGNKLVKAMGSGTITWTDVPRCSTEDKGTWHSLWVQTGSIYIQYTHLKCIDKSQGDSVSTGEILGEYGLYGSTNFEHLHITFLSSPSTASCIDPGPYWPGGIPTFAYPNKPSDISPCQ